MQMVQYLHRHTENFELAFFTRKHMFNSNTQDIHCITLYEFPIYLPQLTIILE